MVLGSCKAHKRHTWFPSHPACLTIVSRRMIQGLESQVLTACYLDLTCVVLDIQANVFKYDLTVRIINAIFSDRTCDAQNLRVLRSICLKGQCTELIMAQFSLFLRCIPLLEIQLMQMTLKRASAGNDLYSLLGRSHFNPVTHFHLKRVSRLYFCEYVNGHRMSR